MHNLHGNLDQETRDCERQFLRSATPESGLYIASVDKYVNVNVCDAITRLWSDFKGALIDTPLKLGQEWVIISHGTMGVIIPLRMLNYVSKGDPQMETLPSTYIHSFSDHQCIWK